MSGREWNPEQYERFHALRARPFWDLAALVEVPVDGAIERAVDLGCGTGELTARLARRLGIGEMIGIDSSPNMLAATESHAGDGVRFDAGDIGVWTASAELDLVFSNAALHWVPDHPSVLARWTNALRAGGQIAVQVPANHDHPSHLASVAVAGRDPFLTALDGDPPADPVAANVLPPEAYAELLFDLGLVDQQVRLQVYPQLMTSSADVVEWTKGTSLTRFFARLPAELHAPFVDAYRRELLDRIGDRAPYLYTFKRILLWGRSGRS